MWTAKRAGGARAVLLGAVLCGFLGAGVLTQTVSAADLGPYFLLPNSLSVTGSPKESLLKMQASWLQNGLDKLKQARTQAADELEKGKAGGAKPEQIAALEEKLKKLDHDMAAAGEELDLANDNSPAKEIQKERKRLFLLAVNQWINELNRLATEQMKIAIMTDGMESQAAQNRNFQLSQQADDLEKATQDITITDWATIR